MRRLALIAILAISLAAHSADTLTVSAHVVGSILLNLDTAGHSTSGAGAATVSATGSLSTPPEGFSVTRNGNQWKLSSTIDARALKANLPNTSYTLTARLSHAPNTGVSWQVNGVLLSDTTAAIVTDAATFGASASYSWDIVIADSTSSAPIDNTILFTVIAK